MAMPTVKTIRLPEDLVRAILHRARLENVDESTAIRQLLALGVKGYAVKLYREGKVSLAEAANLANISLREMIDVLLDHGVKGNIRADQQEKAIKFITKL
jgi:hypothetical protein